MQCTEPSERTRVFLHPHSKEEIEKKMVLKTLDAKNLLYLLAFNTVLWSSGWPKRLWNETGRLSTSCAFVSVLVDQQYSNAAFALFASALKLKLSPRQSRLKNKE